MKASKFSEAQKAFILKQGEDSSFHVAFATGIAGKGDHGSVSSAEGISVRLKSSPL